MPHRTPHYEILEACERKLRLLRCQRPECTNGCLRAIGECLSPFPLDESPIGDDRIIFGGARQEQSA